jgi:hypothetical protein
MVAQTWGSSARFLSIQFGIVITTSTYAIVASCQVGSMNATLKQNRKLAEQSIRRAVAAATQAAICGPIKCGSANGRI